MDINAKNGDKIKVTQKTINRCNTYYQEKAKKHLKVDNIYTVKNTNKGEFHSTVMVKEIPNVVFNQQLFESVKE